MQPLGKMLVLMGGLILLVGVVLMFSDKLPFLGKLPGDISIKRENFQFYFPITTGIVLSVLLVSCCGYSLTSKESKVMKTLTAAMLMLLLCSVPSNAQTEAKEPKARTVSVRGIGYVKSVPDQLRLSVQVNTRTESASSAMTQASAKTRQILDILKSYGVDDKDIQTSRVTVAPVLDYQRNVQPPPIVGYTGTNEFSVLFKGKTMEKVGEFMDKAVVAGASSFGGLNYEASKQRELERDALKKAATDAQARADVLAKELGAQLGKVMSISESVAGPIPVRGIMSDAMSASAPVMTGELSISAQADVVFELK